jgi:hypothetical protein
MILGSYNFKRRNMLIAHKFYYRGQEKQSKNVAKDLISFE